MWVSSQASPSKAYVNPQKKNKMEKKIGSDGFAILVIKQIKSN